MQARRLTILSSATLIWKSQSPAGKWHLIKCCFKYTGKPWWAFFLHAKQIQGELVFSRGWRDMSNLYLLTIFPPDDSSHSLSNRFISFQKQQHSEPQRQGREGSSWGIIWSRKIASKERLSVYTYHSTAQAAPSHNLFSCFKNWSLKILYTQHLCNLPLSGLNIPQYRNS